MSIADFENMAAQCVASFGLSTQVRLVFVTAAGARNATTRVATVTTTALTLSAIRYRTGGGGGGGFGNSAASPAGESWEYDVTAADFVAAGGGNLPGPGDELIENYQTASEKKYYVRSSQRMVNGAVIRIRVGQDRSGKK